MRPSTGFVMEAVESRTLMSSTVFMEFVPGAVVAELHAGGVSTGLLATVQQQDSAPQAAPQHANGGPSGKPSAGQHVIPTAIAGVVASNLDAHTVKLTWTKVDRLADTIELDYSSDGVHFATLGMLKSNQTSFVASGLESGRTYSFELFAMNKKGMSQASEIVSTVLG